MLKTSRWILRILNWLNWGIGVPMVLALLTLGFTTPDALIAAFRHGGIADPALLLDWMRWAGALTVPIIICAHIIFTRLIAIIDTVASGAVFSAANAMRLRTIAWALLGTQIVDLIYGSMTASVSEESGLYLGWSPGLTGWIAVLLLFVLARIFRHGAVMRDELEGTV